MKILNNKGQSIETCNMDKCGEFIAETSETNSVFTVEVSDKELEGLLLDGYSHELWRLLLETIEGYFYVKNISYNSFQLRKGR